MNATAPGGEPEVATEDVEWRRLHKITPLLNAWKAIAAIFGVLVYQNYQFVTELWEQRDTLDWGLVGLIAAGGLLLFALLVVGYSALAWRRMRYAVGEDAVYFHRGILFRNQSYARLNRIQAVDVVRPLLGRVFGLSRLKIETAGGSGLGLAYLRDAEAERVRREVLARVQERRASRADEAPEADAPADETAAAPAGDAGRTAGPDALAADEPELPIHAVPTGRLLGSLVRSGSLIFFIILVVALIAAAIAVGSPAPLFGTIPGLIGWVAALWSRFNAGFNFRSSVSVDGIRLRHGLLEQRTQTLPPGRVHAVQLKQPLLWRRKGWWQVTASVAGYGDVAHASDLFRGNSLLPVGSQGEALTALWLVMPDLGVPESDVRTVIDGALTGTGTDGGFYASPRAARWLDPISWRRNGLLVTERGIILRGGRLSRWVSIIPHPRTQSLAILRGPLQRALGLNSFHVAGVMGPVRLQVSHLDPAQVLAALDGAATLALRARTQESTEDWLQRMGLPLGAGTIGP
ncbi:MAG TPA: PH domain-containing protein [Actinomycetaceae bacterium]|nr:PH domain-containing protein [Actinomycetaceae bacterium]